MSDSSTSRKSVAAVGCVVAGRYRLTRLIGKGGMGAVYEAEHVEIGKHVAVKLLRSIHARHAEIAARFRREARSASAIESDHIVQVFDAGTDPELGLFMVMELLRGEDLGSLLERAGRLEPLIACSVVLQAASALDKAHGAGIVHRDLKPPNIFLVEREDRTAMVKLVDFGIAKIVRDESTGQGGGLTRMGAAIGTPNYMSPEQAQGLTSLDHRTDIYSLGAVLYEMVVGRPPFSEKATYEQTIVHILTTPVPRAIDSAPHLPPPLDQLIADMMSADPEQRIGTMNDVRERIQVLYPGLEKSGAGLGVMTSPESPRMRAQTNVAVTYDALGADTWPEPSLGSLERRTKVLWPAIAVVAAVVGVVGAAALSRLGRKPAASIATDAGLVMSVLSASPVAPQHFEAPAFGHGTPVAPAASASEGAKPTAPAKPAAATGSAKSRAAVPREKPGKPTEQVGGVGISTEF